MVYASQQTCVLASLGRFRALCSLAMAMARHLRLCGARPRSRFSALTGSTNRNAVDHRAFCSLEEASNSQPLTLENLGFGEDGQSVELDLTRAPLREGGSRLPRRTPEKSPRMLPSVVQAPSAEEMKQAALEASYILAGIAGMRLRQKKPAVVKDATRSAAEEEGLQQQAKGEAEAEAEEEENEDTIAKLEKTTYVVELSHPWPEWIEFLTYLRIKGFFEGSEQGAEEGKHLFESNAAVRHAVSGFGRGHSEIFNCLSRKDLRVLATFGCPDVERKASNASKRLRAHFRISEGDVCQRCRLKMTCPRAFFAPEANMRMNTLDVVRIITGFATNVWPNADSYVAYPPDVGSSVCSLLRAFLAYKILPKDDELVPPERSALESGQSLKKQIKNNPPVEPKPGDWACPNCEFLNFNRNRRCRECGVFRPQKEQNAYVGDWHCPKCRYLNFSKNRYCRECNVERSTNVKWMGGERLPDNHPAANKMPTREGKYEASDDEEASDMSLTNPDESNVSESDGSFSDEEERALSKGLSNAARRLSKASFKWDESKEEEGFSGTKRTLSGLIMKSKRPSGRTSRKH